MIFQTFYGPIEFESFWGVSLFRDPIRLRAPNEPILFELQQWELKYEGECYAAGAAMQAELGPGARGALFNRPPGDGEETNTGDAEPWQAEFEKIHRHLDEFATVAFNLLRWRLGIGGGPGKLESPLCALMWSANDDLEGTRLRFREGFIPTPSSPLSLREFWGDVSHGPSIEGISFPEVLGGSPPYDCLPHTLLHQAKNSRRTNPRVAYLLAVVAAETGLKRALEKLKPDAGALLRRGPSPDPRWLLRTFLRQCTEEARCTFNGRVLPPPKTRANRLEIARPGGATGVDRLDIWDRAFQFRNEIAHMGGAEPDPDELRVLLDATHDLLYLLDYYLGFKWALDYLRPETLEALEEEAR